MTQQYRLICTSLLWTLSLAPVMAENAPLQELASIREAVEAHVLQRHQDRTPAPEVRVGNLDNRLQLAACPNGLETYESPGFKPIGRTTVGVRCKDSNNWSLYVPVSISVQLQAVIVTRDLKRGEILQASDLDSAPFDSSQLLYGYLDQPEQAIGRRLLRNLNRQTALTPSMLAVNKAVSRGSEVTLITKAGSLQVRMKGKAIGDGGIGERILVQNLSSKRKVEGTIVSPGLVEVR